MPPRQGRQPPSGRCALGLPPPSRLPPRCCRLPACASARPPWEVLSVPALAGTPATTAPTGGPPARPPSCPCCQPVSLYLRIPHRLVLHVVDFSFPSLSPTVVIHAFIIDHRLGSSTLFGLAVRFQHVGLQSSHGGGAPRIIPLPISSRTYDLIHCASASADQLYILHCLPFMTSSSLRFRIGLLGTDSLHPAFHTRWA